MNSDKKLLFKTEDTTEYNVYIDILGLIGAGSVSQIRNGVTIK